jgi:hypothetical protein
MSESETVNHPAHYNTGEIEAIEFIADQGLARGFCLGSAIKYLSRAGKKPSESEAQDLRKAAWYANWYADYLERTTKPTGDSAPVLETAEAIGEPPAPLPAVPEEEPAVSSSESVESVESVATAPVETPPAPVTDAPDAPDAPTTPTTPTKPSGTGWQKYQMHPCPDCGKDCMGVRCRACAQKYARTQRIGWTASESESPRAPAAPKADAPVPSRVPRSSPPPPPNPTPATLQTTLPVAPGALPTNLVPAPVIKLDPIVLTTKQTTERARLRAEGINHQIAAEQGWFHIVLAPDPPYAPSLCIWVDPMLPDGAEFVETCTRRGQHWYSGDALIGRAQVRVSTPGAFLAAPTPKEVTQVISATIEAIAVPGASGSGIGGAGVNSHASA